MARLAFALACATIAPAHAADRPVAVGDRVVPTQKNITLVMNGEAIEQSSHGLTLYLVRAIDGGSLLLEPAGAGARGWAPADQFVAFDRAIAHFTRVIGSGDTSGFTLAARGFLRCEAREWDSAIRDFDDAIKLDAQTPWYFLGRGRTWREKKLYDRAIIDLNEAIRLDPKYAEAFIERGASHRARGEIGKAIGDFSEAIWLNPRSVAAYKNRGRAWFAKNEPGKAIVDYNVALRFDSRDVEALCDRGEARKALGEFGSAMDDFSAAIQADAKCARAHGCQAIIWSSCPELRFRDKRRAIEAGLRACTLTDWKEVSLIEILAAAYAKAGDYEAAVRYQIKANAVRRDDQDPADGEARLKRYEERKSSPAQGH
jgi:tetratricopeptide (TPR) repeat protein